MTPDIREITDWFLSLIGGTGKPVGNHEIPELPNTKSPHFIVYSIPGGGFSGPALTAPHADAEMVFQVTSVGWQPQQAQWMAALARRTVIDRTAGGAFQVAGPTPPTGWVVNDRRPLGGPGGVDSEGNLPHRVYSVVDRYVVCVTPA